MAGLNVNGDEGWTAQVLVNTDQDIDTGYGSGGWERVGQVMDMGPAGFPIYEATRFGFGPGFGPTEGFGTLTMVPEGAGVRVQLELPLAALADDGGGMDFRFSVSRYDTGWASWKGGTWASTVFPGPAPTLTLRE